jgi:hypothetical protein
MHCLQFVALVLATAPVHRYLAARDAREEPDTVGRPGRPPRLLATDLDHRVRRDRHRPEPD